MKEASRGWLLEAFNMRVSSDYGIESAITAQDAASLLEQTREFLREARRYLAGTSSP